MNTLRYAAIMLILHVTGGTLFGYSEIPLYLNQVLDSDNQPKFTVGLYVGIGGGTPKLYQLDTGNDMFIPAYSNNLDEGVDPWWGNDFDLDGSVSGSETFGGKTIDFNTANASIAFYNNASSETPIVSSNGRITVAQGTSAHVEDQPSNVLPWQENAEAGKAVLLEVPDSSPTEYTYYGNFGAGLFSFNSDQGLYPVLGQFVSDSGDTLRGYSISFNSGTMTLYYDSDFEGGNNPVAEFDQAAQLTLQEGVTFPTTGYPTSMEDGLLVKSVTAGGETSELPFFALLDSGGINLEMPYDATFQDIVSNIGGGDYAFDSELNFLMQLAGLEGESDAILGFKTGNINQDNFVELLGASQDGYNLGWDLFMHYDVYFDAQNSVLRFKQVPEPEYFAVITAFLALVWVYLRRRT